LPSWYLCEASINTPAGLIDHNVIKCYLFAKQAGFSLQNFAIGALILCQFAPNRSLS